MKRVLAVLSLVGAIAIPVAVVAQSPSPGPVDGPVLQDVCLSGAGVPVQDPLELAQGILDETITVAFGPCTAVPGSSPSALPSAAAVATTEPAAVATPRPTKKPSFKKLSKRTFQKLVRSPDDHIGERVQVWACISQFDAATGPDTFRGEAAHTRLGEFGWYVDSVNSLFTGDEDRLEEFVEHDLVWMNATVGGSFSYDTQNGGNTTAPIFLVEKIQRKGSC